MPLLPSPLGLLPFVGIKLAGYTAFATRLDRRYQGLPSSAERSAQGPPRPLVVGAIRTGIGILCGVGYALVLGLLFADSLPELGLFVALAPLRALEWALVIGKLYDPALRHKRLLARSCTEGTLLSYALDVPAFGIWFLLPGVPMC